MIFFLSIICGSFTSIVRHMDSNTQRVNLSKIFQLCSARFVELMRLTNKAKIASQSPSVREQLTASTWTAHLNSRTERARLIYDSCQRKNLKQQLSRLTNVYGFSNFTETYDFQHRNQLIQQLHGSGNAIAVHVMEQSEKRAAINSERCMSCINYNIGKICD